MSQLDHWLGVSRQNNMLAVVMQRNQHTELWAMSGEGFLRTLQIIEDGISLQATSIENVAASIEELSSNVNQSLSEASPVAAISQGALPSSICWRKM